MSYHRRILQCTIGLMREGNAMNASASSASFFRATQGPIQTCIDSISSMPFSSRGFASSDAPSTSSETVHIKFVEKNGKESDVEAPMGKSLMEVAHENDIDLEGACEGSLACSTCHVILPRNYYEKLEEPTDDEQDMLDLAFGLTDTSRLGCQVIVSKDLEGCRVTIPSATRNMAVDGYKPKPH